MNAVPPLCPELSDLELEQAHTAIQRAIGTTSIDGLNIVGFGEMTLAVAWPAAAPTTVLKRLPPFSTASRFDDYALLFREHLARLQERGVPHVPTELRTVPGDGDAVHGYLVQPVVPRAALAPALVRHGTDDEARELFRQIVTYVVDAVDETVGLDAQLANWADLDGRLATLDVSTPFMRTSEGEERLDLGLFRAAYPVMARVPLRRWLTPRVLDTYYDPRSVLRDVAANMLRQGLHAHLPLWLAVANDRLTQPLSEGEVQQYFKADARTWAFLQRLRRLDRWWQRNVRRRVYPFLLPPRYDSRTDYADMLGSGH